MKKSLVKLLVIVFVLAFSASCEETLVPVEEPDDLLLKSAGADRVTYIVVLDDAELKAELSKMKGYEKKQDVMKAASAKILKRAGVFDDEIGYVLSLIHI